MGADDSLLVGKHHKLKLFLHELRKVN
jgi:hypothetical protein